jgi:dTDP-4-dehydrorhamnose 3,5-epimerase-like enzyme
MANYNSKKNILHIITFKTPEFKFEDSRGNFKQLFSCGWKQVNIIISEANSTRGGHYHKNNKEFFYVIEGAFELKLQLKGISYTFLIEKDDFFEIDINTMHDFYFLEKTVIVSGYDKGVITAEGKDIFTA